LGGHVRILSGVITSYPGSDAGTTQEASIYPGGFLAIDTYTDENAPYSRMDHEGVRTNGYISAESGYKYGEDNPGITQDVTIGDKKLIIKGGIITGV
jgi:hypothetical protein